MAPTPLQTMLGLTALHRDLRGFVESVLVLVGLLGAFAVRRRKRAVTSTTFLLLSGSVLIDAGSRFIPNETIGEKIAVAAFVLFLFGVIRLVLEAVDAVTRRGKVHFSTIGKDLLMLVLWFVVLMVVLYTDFGVQPLSILTTTTVFAAVLGFALQETLGNIFSGLSLSMGHAVRAGRLDPQRPACRAGQGNRVACDDDRNARQRAAGDSQLRDCQGRAVQLRHRRRARRNSNRNQLRRAAQSCARSRAHPAARRAASAARAAARSSGVGLCRFLDPIPDQILDRGLRRAGIRARSRRVGPLVRAQTPFDRDSVPDPHRPCARRAPGPGRQSRRRPRAGTDGRPAPCRFVARPERRRASIAGADRRGAPVRRGRDADARRRTR